MAIGNGPDMDLGADAGEWYTALTSVLALHKPDPHAPQGETDFCGECAHCWPCATIRTIADAVFYEFNTEE
ncbi:MAG: hypothetical protein ACRDRO_19240 [Pseudonocardiaceae bacterium]